MPMSARADPGHAHAQAARHEHEQEPAEARSARRPRRPATRPGRSPARSRWCRSRWRRGGPGGARALCICSTICWTVKRAARRAGAALDPARGVIVPGGHVRHPPHARRRSRPSPCSLAPAARRRHGLVSAQGRPARRSRTRRGGQEGRAQLVRAAAGQRERDPSRSDEGPAARLPPPERPALLALGHRALPRHHGRGHPVGRRQVGPGARPRARRGGQGDVVADEHRRRQRRQLRPLPGPPALTTAAARSSAGSSATTPRSTPTTGARSSAPTTTAGRRG